MVRTRSAISSKATAASRVSASVSWTSAIEPTRRTASSSADPRLRRAEPTRLQAQQRGDGLQVVLHPVVDLADGRVLAQQLPVAVAQLRHVTDEDERADALALEQQRDRPQPHGRPVGRHLTNPRRATADDRSHRLVDRLAAADERRGDGAEVRVGEVGGEPEPAVRRQRVRARVSSPDHRRRAGSARRRRGRWPQQPTVRRGTGSCPLAPSARARRRCSGTRARVETARARQRGSCAAQRRRPVRHRGHAPGSSPPAPARRAARPGRPHGRCGPRRTPHRSAGVRRCVRPVRRRHRQSWSVRSTDASARRRRTPAQPDGQSAAGRAERGPRRTGRRAAASRRQASCSRSLSAGSRSQSRARMSARPLPTPSG